MMLVPLMNGEGLQCYPSCQYLHGSIFKTGQSILAANNLYSIVLIYPQLFFALIMCLYLVALGSHFTVLIPVFSVSGTYTEIKNATNITACVQACCNNSNCHVAMLHNQHCFNIQCKDIQSCQLTPKSGTSLVVVRNIDSGGSGEDAEWIGKPT